jgi:hypothetical protein
MVHIAKRHMTGLVFLIEFKQPSDGLVFVAYVQPNLQGMDLGHKAKVDHIIDGATGNTGSLLISDEMLEITFDYIPEGDAIASALTAAYLPQIGSAGKITTAPIIQIGTFADAFNTGAKYSWLYEGDASVHGKPEEKWTGKITLKRYASMTDPVGITV